MPFLDLARANEVVKRDVLRGVGRLIDSGDFTLGQEVHRFEAEFATYVGVESAVGMGSGLDALTVGLRALGVEPGSEVIVPANTFVGTFEAVSHAGCVPVPVDASFADLNIDVSAITDACTPRTAAIVPVHLYGQLADMARLMAIAECRGIDVLEDACQAHGATRGQHGAGASGKAAAFSFYPSKNLGAFGDAGALVTNDADIAGTARMLRNHGQREKSAHELVGYTSRLDTIQAVVLRAKLRHLDAAAEARRRIADQYDDALAGVGDMQLPRVVTGSKPTWHLYVVRTDRRDDLRRHLAAAGVGTAVHYLIPPHLTVAYRSLGYREGSFPVTEELARTALSLPMFVGLSEAQIEKVAAEIRRFYGHR